jgi:hypothetical protein
VVGKLREGRLLDNEDWDKVPSRVTGSIICEIEAVVGTNDAEATGTLGWC